MKIKSVSVSWGATISLGEKTYEFVRVDTGLEAELDPGEDRKVVRKKLLKEVQGFIGTQVAKVRKEVEEG